MQKFEVALKIKAKHGKLQKFIDRMGWTQADFARHLGITNTTVGEWFNLQNFPRRKDLLERVCDLLGDTPENCFPEFLRDPEFLARSKKALVYREVDLTFLPHHELDALPSGDSVEDHIEAEQSRKCISSLLETLSPRQAEVVRLRYGIDRQEHTMAEVGEIIGVCPERVRQIEARALRLLRHPKRARYIKPD